MFKKRLFAYVIDILILNMILSIVNMIIPTSDTVNNLSNSFLNFNSDYLDGKLDFMTYINQASSISYNLDKNIFLTNLISVFIGIVYFALYPLYNNGQSIGKKLCGIQIVSKNGECVSSNSLVIRYFFMNSIGVSIISLCLIFITKDLLYVLITGILGFLQFLVAFISIFMVLYRHEKRSIPDLIAGTSVIEVK